MKNDPFYGLNDTVHRPRKYLWPWQRNRKHGAVQRVALEVMEVLVGMWLIWLCTEGCSTPAVAATVEPTPYSICETCGEALGADAPVDGECRGEQ